MGRCRPPKKRKNKACYIFSFAAGIFIASFFPYDALMIVLSIVLVMLGFAYLKCP